MADQQLPGNDRNLQLAREIGQTRANATPLSGLNDLIVPQLLAFRQQSRRSYQADETGKQEVWQNIAVATSTAGQQMPLSRLIGSKSLRWAAAAVVLIGALISFAYFQFGQGPEPLDQSGTAIKTVQLSDGSTVTLRPHSRLLAVEETAAAPLYELQGEARFEVTPNRSRTFSVQTETGRVSVLGTRFILSSWGGRTRVFLEEGSVEVKALQKDRTVVLKPGQSVSIAAGSGISRATTAQAEEFTDWLKQQLIFHNRPAGQIARELEQQFHISITLPDNIAENKLSGRLSLEDLQTSLGDLRLVLGGAFVQTGEGSYMFEPN